MKMKKRLLAVAMLMIVAIFMSMNALALDVSENPSATVYSQDETRISPRIGCSVCTIGMCFSLCFGDLTLDDTSTHTYDWWSKTCTVGYYTSTGAYQCDTCGHIRPLDYVDEFGDQHLCKEIHSSCGRGTYNVCTFGGYL